MANAGKVTLSPLAGSVWTPGVAVRTGVGAGVGGRGVAAGVAAGAAGVAVRAGVGDACAETPPGGVSALASSNMTPASVMTAPPTRSHLLILWSLFAIVPPL